MTRQYPLPPDFVCCPHCLVRMSSTFLGRHLGVCPELARKRDTTATYEPGPPWSTPTEFST